MSISLLPTHVVKFHLKSCELYGTD